MVRTAPAQAVATRAHAQRHQHFHPSPSAPRLLIYLLATATLAPPRACTQHPPHPQQRTTNTTQHPSSLCGRPPRARNERSKRAIINCHSPRNSPMSAALTIDQPHSATPNDTSATPHSTAKQCTAPERHTTSNRSADRTQSPRTSGPFPHDAPALRTPECRQQTHSVMRATPLHFCTNPPKGRPRQTPLCQPTKLAEHSRAAHGCLGACSSRHDDAACAVALHSSSWPCTFSRMAAQSSPPQHSRCRLLPALLRGTTLSAQRPTRD